MQERKIFIFFFQAEDGIRDKLVTGVQTCALPISHAIGANARSVCQEPPESATDTAVSFGLLPAALPTNHHAEQHRSSHLVTTRAHCHWSVSHICLTAL